MSRRFTVSPGTALGLAALFFALGGPGYAAINGTAAAKKHKHVKAKAVTTAQVNVLIAAYLKKHPVAGPAGAPGATGPAGPAGATGNAGAVGPSTGPAGGALAGSFPNPTLALGAIGTTSIADASITQSKLNMKIVTAQQAFGANTYEVAIATCPAGYSIFNGGGGVIDSGDVELTNIAALSYSGPVPFGNAWQVAAYRTYTNPQVNSQYGLIATAVCITS